MNAKMCFSLSPALNGSVLFAVVVFLLLGYGEIVFSTSMIELDCVANVSML